jgi:hypothetical protein
MCYSRSSFWFWQSQIYQFSTFKAENLVLPELSKDGKSVILKDERWYFLSKRRDFTDKRFFWGLRNL